MPFEDDQEAYLPYTHPAQFLRIVVRWLHALTASVRRVTAEVVVAKTPIEQQLIPTKKWSHCIEISFNRQLPSLSWRRFGLLNELLLVTEEDQLLFGVYFVRLRTDRVERFDLHQLTLAICKVFDWSLDDCKIYRKDKD